MADESELDCWGNQVRPNEQVRRSEVEVGVLSLMEPYVKPDTRKPKHSGAKTDKEDKELCKANSLDLLDRLQGHERDIGTLKKLIEKLFDRMIDDNFWKVMFRCLRYSDYLETHHWKAKAAEARNKAGNRCSVCNSNGMLHAHHRTYENLGNEHPSDIICLCAECHNLFHDNRKIEG